jgi:hypothetical protein
MTAKKMPTHRYGNTQAVVSSLLLHSLPHSAARHEAAALRIAKHHQSMMAPERIDSFDMTPSKKAEAK